MKSDQIYDYPCTRIIDVKGFGAYLEQEIQKPRRNLRLFTKELSDCLTQGHDDISHHITLTN
ncbi:MAG: hypothetical protein LUC91_11525, partial [Prevotella sp.]|nr:hypothetical protein [Prevotella sp.]